MRIVATLCRQPRRLRRRAPRHRASKRRDSKGTRRSGRQALSPRSQRPEIGRGPRQRRSTGRARKAKPPSFDRSWFHYMTEFRFRGSAHRTTYKPRGAGLGRAEAGGRTRPEAARYCSASSQATGGKASRTRSPATSIPGRRDGTRLEFGRARPEVADTTAAWPLNGSGVPRSGRPRNLP